jgi:hypothetical protein
MLKRIAADAVTAVSGMGADIARPVFDEDIAAIRSVDAGHQHANDITDELSFRITRTATPSNPRSL